MSIPRHKATFSHNHFTKIYWGLIIVGLIVMVTSVSGWVMQMICGVFALAIIGIALKSMTHTVTIYNNRVTSKDFFTKKFITILPSSRIYVKRRLQVFNFIIRHYDYAITIDNTDEILKINANVNDADTLFAMINELEVAIIAPKQVEFFAKKNAIRMDDKFVLTLDSLIYNGKPYEYAKLSSISIDNGNLLLKKQGKMWETSVLSIPLSEVPNVNTFMSIVQATS